MSYQVTIARNSTRNQTKFWFIASSAALIFLLNTVGTVFNIDPDVSNTVNVTTTIAAIVAIAVLYFRKGDIFLKIEEEAIEYFDFRENQLISIPVADIQSVTTRFGELHLCTAQRTYCIDTTVIRNEKTRWEIKEMIKAMAPADYRSLNLSA